MIEFDFCCVKIVTKKQTKNEIKIFIFFQIILLLCKNKLGLQLQDWSISSIFLFHKKYQ